MGDEPRNQPSSNPLPQVNVSELVPQRFRAWVYPVGAVVGLVTWLVAEVTLIWFPEYTEQIGQTANRVLAVVTIITGGLGTAYPPKAP